MKSSHSLLDDEDLQLAVEMSQSIYKDDNRLERLQVGLLPARCNESFIFSDDGFVAGDPLLG